MPVWVRIVNPTGSAGMQALWWYDRSDLRIQYKCLPTRIPQAGWSMLLRDSQVIEIFRELPEHRGCKSEELEAVEKEFDVRLPLVYCDLMKLDETRLAGAGIVAPLNRLGELRREAASILVEDGHSFRLGPSDIVFAWEDIFAFYFFTANGTIDPPVMMFNYYDSGNNGQAVIQSDTLTAYFAEALRRYLTLN